MAKGKIKYVPKNVLDELNNISKVMNVKPLVAFEELVRRARIGAEFEQKVKRKIRDKNNDEFCTW